MFSQCDRSCGLLIFSAARVIPSTAAPSEAIAVSSLQTTAPTEVQTTQPPKPPRSSVCEGSPIEQDRTEAPRVHVQRTPIPEESTPDESDAPFWKQKHFYMHLGLAYRDVDAEALDSYALSTPERVVGRHYPCYTAALEDEEDWYAQPYHADEDWQSRFALLQETILANYRNV